jgi:1-acyl-sn-glycerol-3-phosphate acyltransferase
MINLLRKIHLVYFSLWLILLFVVFWPFYYWFTRHPRFYGLLNKCRTLHSFLCTALSGVYFNFKYQTKLNPNTTYIYCANHTSNLDIVIFCLLAHGRYHFMGKEELLNNPVLGIFFRSIDISVSRSSKIAAFRSFKRASENLKKGMSLIIFPEGKIDDIYPPHLQEFKSGPFKLAIENNIEIVPVSIANVWNIFWDDGLKFGTRPGIVDVFVHKPISTTILAAENDDELKDRVFEMINSKL